ncbi:hypothetical protein LVJ94_26800 [Pendulispora rubella]|uniref:Uncharacterized protein n=1 Tax=Pendulispora rubella TaxID=2741070 RepID=A0ABZ2KPB7_9BACT
MKTMAYTMVGRTSVNVYAADSPDDAEWDTYLRYRTKHMGDIERVLIHTRGGSASMEQRERLIRIPPRALHVPGAVITSSGYVRAMYRVNQYALWKVFSETEWAEAFRHLGLRDDERPAVFSAMERLSASLNLPCPPFPNDIPNVHKRP